MQDPDFDSLDQKECVTTHGSQNIPGVIRLARLVENEYGESMGFFSGGNSKSSASGTVMEGQFPIKLKSHVLGTSA